MNNLFFGDERDFFKYALLRVFARAGVRIGVCWMLTSGHRDDGKIVGYLKSGKHKEKDPVLFDFLRHHVCERNRRDVALLEQGWKGEKVIPQALFFRAPFLNTERGKYFEKMIKKFANRDLIFFDPDTGIEPKRRGRNPLMEYLRWNELKSVADSEKEKSLMIFQYFRLHWNVAKTKERHGEIIARLKEVGGDKAEVFSLWHSHIAYYFIARDEFKEQFPRYPNCLCDKIGFTMRR